MIHGEYAIKIGNGAWKTVPNQFTIYGMQTLLRAAFWQVTPVLAMGLCGRNPGSMIALASAQEPSAVNGYARQAVPMNQVNWPVLSSVNGESYIESREVLFPLTGAVDVPVNRLFLTDGIQILSISSELEDGLSLYDEPIATKYRLFSR